MPPHPKLRRVRHRKDEGAAGTLPYRPCVGIVLVNAEGLVFAGQRRDGGMIENGPPAWQMPQGGIDPGETPGQAALRELHEETGLLPEHVKRLAKTHRWITYDLPPELLGKIWGGKYRGQRQKWFLLRFEGTDSDVNIATEEAEFSAWRWMRAEDLAAQIVPFKRAVYEEVIAAFRAYLA